MRKRGDLFLLFIGCIMRRGWRFPFVLANCFLFLQAADVLLTCGLLGRADVYEANPLALAVFARQGRLGLALLKLACTAIALVAALLVWRWRPVAGIRLLTAGCAVMTLVAGYSLALLFRPADPTVRDLHRALEDGAALADRIDELHHFNAARLAICRDLLEGRSHLPLAIQAMAICITDHRSCLTNDHVLPPTDQPSRVAAYLLLQTALRTENTPAQRARLAVLRAEAASLYPGPSFAPTFGAALVPDAASRPAVPVATEFARPFR